MDVLDSELINKNTTLFLWIKDVLESELINQ